MFSDNASIVSSFEFLTKVVLRLSSIWVYLSSFDVSHKMLEVLKACDGGSASAHAGRYPG